MPETPFLEYGVAIASMGVLAFVVQKFLKHLEKKDADFTAVISNHLSSSKQVTEQLIASNNKMSVSHERLESAITKLIDKLE